MRFQWTFLVHRNLDAILDDDFHFMSQDFQLRGHVDVERAHKIVKAESTDTRM